MDFIEHIRTVHFALVGLSVGLILTLLSAKPYHANTALRELDQIIELKKLWSPTWIYAHANRSQQPPGNEDDDWTINAFENRGLDAEMKLGRPYRKRYAIKFLPPQENWVRGGDDNDNGDADWSPKSFPSTLTEFEQWWNRMAKTPYMLYFPTSIKSRGVGVRADRKISD